MTRTYWKLLCKFWKNLMKASASVKAEGLFQSTTEVVIQGPVPVGAALISDCPINWINYAVLRYTVGKNSEFLNTEGRQCRERNTTLPKNGCGERGALSHRQSTRLMLQPENRTLPPQLLRILEVCHFVSTPHHITPSVAVVVDIFFLIWIFFLCFSFTPT